MSYVTPGARANATVATLNLNAMSDQTQAQSGTEVRFTGQWFMDDESWPVPAADTPREKVPLIRQAGPKMSVEIAYGRNDLPVLALAVHQSPQITYRRRTGEPLVLDAVQRGNRDAVRVLLGRGDSPDHTDAQGKTLLIIAASRGDIGMIAALLPYGPDLNRQDNNGNTALMYASSQNNLCAIELLTRAGANRSLRNLDGQTASSIAKANGFDVAYRLLAWGN